MVSCVMFIPSSPLMWQVAQVGTGMSAVVSFRGSAWRLKWAFLGVEDDAVLGLVVDLDLGMVRAHVALAAGFRHAGQFDRGRMPRVARGAGADGAVGVRLADVMAHRATLA